MKWKPFGKDSITEIEAFRKGCANSPCVHLTADIAMQPKNARRIAATLIKAADYAEGKK